MYLDGTYEAYAERLDDYQEPRCRRAHRTLISIEELEEMTEGLPRAEAYRLIAARVRHEVENLRDRHEYAV